MISFAPLTAGLAEFVDEDEAGGASSTTVGGQVAAHSHPRHP